MKRLYTQTYGISNQQRYLSLIGDSEIPLLFPDKPSTLLQKKRFTFRGKRLATAMFESLRRLILQALPQSIKLHLGQNAQVIKLNPGLVNPRINGLVKMDLVNNP